MNKSMRDGHWSHCYHCKSAMWMPEVLYEAAFASRFNERPITFYCSYGHPQVFAKGESQMDAMRRERDRAVQELARSEESVKQLRGMVDTVVREREALKMNFNAIKKRARHGVCPCCNRQFVNMAKHMKTKHPEYAVR